MKQLWLIRHALPLVAAGVCYGRLDVRADPAHTASAAAQLARALPQGLRVRCSTLQRCELLALDLSRLRPDLTLKMDTRLVECGFGAWEGQRWDALPRGELDAWAQHFAHYRPGHGESLSAMLRRVHQALNEVAQDEAWITHAGVARCVQWLTTQPPGVLPATAMQWDAPAPGFGGWITVPV
jgi:alpha-ribazole phosphatase